MRAVQRAQRWHWARLCRTVGCLWVLSLGQGGLGLLPARRELGGARLASPRLSSPLPLPRLTARHLPGCLSEVGAVAEPWIPSALCRGSWSWLLLLNPPCNSDSQSNAPAFPSCYWHTRLPQPAAAELAGWQRWESWDKFPPAPGSNAGGGGESPVVKA